MIMHPTLFAVPLLAVCLGLAACGGDDDADPATGVARAEPTIASGSSSQQSESVEAGKEKAAERRAEIGLAVATGESQFGTILFDEKDRAIYLFDKEQSANSECYGDCAVAWPPVLTKGQPVASAGVDSKLLGTTERDDGTTQVTYGGRPLYYYVDDPPKQVLCHNVEEFGGLWLVVEPDGKPAV